MIAAGDRRQLVFSDFQFGEIPSVYFYDVQMQKETRQFKGASMLLGSLQNNDGRQSKNVYYFYADKNFAEVTNNLALYNIAIRQQWGKPCECPIAMAAESVVDSQGELQVIDLLNHSDLPSLTHQVTHPVVTNQPQYDWKWFKSAENTVTHFRQDEDNFIAVSNNKYGAEKMVIYKVENPSKVTCVFSYHGVEDEYMTILPPLKENTIRLLKYEYKK